MISPGYASTTAIKAELAEAGNARVGIGFILWALERNPAVQTLARRGKRPKPAPTSSLRKGVAPAAIPVRHAARSRLSRLSSMPSRRSRSSPPAALPMGAARPGRRSIPVARLKTHFPPSGTAARTNWQRGEAMSRRNTSRRRADEFSQRVVWTG